MWRGWSMGDGVVSGLVSRWLGMIGVIRREKRVRAGKCIDRRTLSFALVFPVKLSRTDCPAATAEST